MCSFVTFISVKIFELKNGVKMLYMQAVMKYINKPLYAGFSDF